MTIVVDASVVVGALVSGGQLGSWCEDRLMESTLLAPHLLPVEVANVLRRTVASGGIGPAAAGAALADVQSLPLTLVPFSPFAARVWALGTNLTAYDAWYVAVAESTDSPLATLDDRLVRAPGPRCTFLTPD